MVNTLNGLAMKAEKETKIILTIPEDEARKVVGAISRILYDETISDEQVRLFDNLHKSIDGAIEKQ